MRVGILGYSGSIRGNLCSTCLLVDRDNLIDAGTGAGGLSINFIEFVKAWGSFALFDKWLHLDKVSVLANDNLELGG
jgi:tRNA A58 N-methylase Trm61